MRNTAPFFVPRLDWLFFLATVGLSLTLLFFGRGKAVVVAKEEIGGLAAHLGKPIALLRRTFDLWQENSALRAQAMNLAQENGELRDAALENARLRAMLDFRQRFPLGLKSAEVIGYPGLQIGGRLLIDAGRRAGVKLNCAVLTPDGLVGKVVEVSELTSLVQTLEGNSYGVSVAIERSRVGGILRWLGPNEWTILGLPTGEDVRPGDLVVTTGSGLVFPGNIRLGVITKVGGQSEANKGWCRVAPFVNFQSVEEVFVITPTGGAWSDSLLAREGHP